MNLQILSNTVKDGRTNYTNDFEMKLIQPIDGLNNEVFFEVTSVSYPSTTKNIANDECWFSFDIKYRNFIWQYTVDKWDDAGLQIISDKFIIPQGIYSLEKLIKYVNSALTEYDIVTFDNNGRVKITANVYVEYWLNQSHAKNTHGFSHDNQQLNHFHLSTTSINKYNNIFFFLIDIDLRFSKKLAFMLGFKSETIQFKQNLDNEKVYTTSQSVVADYLPDISDGLDKMFIYCEELERSFVGDTSSEILALVPIRWSEQGKGNGEVIIYNPPSVKRKFITYYIKR